MIRRKTTTHSAASLFDASAMPARTYETPAPPPPMLFDSWRLLTLDAGIAGETLFGSGIVTRAYLDARAVVGYPETERETALIDALAESLERLYTAVHEASDMITSEEHTAAIDGVESDRRGAETDVDNLRNEVLSLRAERDKIQDAHDELESRHRAAIDAMMGFSHADSIVRDLRYSKATRESLLELLRTILAAHVPVSATNATTLGSLQLHIFDAKRG